MTPLTALLDEAATKKPGAPAIAFAGRTLSYARLRTDVDRLAGSLAAAGVRPGDRVGVLLPNCPQHVIALLAVVRIGGWAVVCNPLASEQQLREQLDGAVAVICLDQVLPTVQAIRDDLRLRYLVVTALIDYYPPAARLQARLPTPKGTRVLGATAPPAADAVPFRSAVRSGSPAAQAKVDPDTDVAVVLHTAGTTGAPVPVELTHTNLVANADQLQALVAETQIRADTTLGVLPLFHRFGLTLGPLVTMRLGGKLVLLPRFEPALVFAAVEAEKPSLFPGAPPLFQALLAAPDVLRRDLRSIRLCISVGMRLPIETVERFERATGARMLEAYGSTEAGITHCNQVTGRRLGTVGRPLVDTEAGILDLKDPDRDAGPGERGELAVHGPQVAVDDWLATGDIAEMDDSGVYTVYGRADDTFVSGLTRVYPSELEELITGVDGVADACVVGVRRGSKVQVTAYVVRYPDSDVTAEGIREELAAKLPASRLPSAIEFRTQLPRSVLGHPLRHEL